MTYFSNIHNSVVCYDTYVDGLFILFTNEGNKYINPSLRDAESGSKNEFPASSLQRKDFKLHEGHFTDVCTSYITRYIMIGNPNRDRAVH